MTWKAMGKRHTSYTRTRQYTSHKAQSLLVVDVS